MSIEIKVFFHDETATLTYVVFDMKTKKAVIIDSVLNYDQYSGKVHTQSADEITVYIKKQNLKVIWILETHIHADHLTASHYLREKLGGKIGMGSEIKVVLAFWVPLFHTEQDTPVDGSQFDQLFENNETIMLGEVPIKILHTPGHTPACVSYLIEDAIFVGDTIFMPDLGTARTDFPGGSAAKLYDSVQRILSLPGETRIFVGHDYPSPERKLSYFATVKEQKAKNVLIHEKIEKNEYITLRNERDKGKVVPKLLLPALQVNMRAGWFGEAESNGLQYIKIPINMSV